MPIIKDLSSQTVLSGGDTQKKDTLSLSGGVRTVKGNVTFEVNSEGV